MILSMLRKVFDPKYSDRAVEEIQADTKRKLEDTTVVAEKHAALLKKNGVMMRIYIATGGDHGD